MDDPVLVRKAKAGDAKAFEALATPCEPMIWRVCWQMMGSREDAQDCAQEAFVKAWSRISSWNEAASFSTWLYRIAVTCCLDALRKKKVRASDSVDAMQESGHDLPARDPGPQGRPEGHGPCRDHTGRGADARTASHAVSAPKRKVNKRR